MPTGRKPRPCITMELPFNCAFMQRATFAMARVASYRVVNDDAPEVELMLCDGNVLHHDKK